MFYLGTHLPHWLWNGESRVPLFVSIRRLRRSKEWKRAEKVPFALDSGGFTELQMYGQWVTSKKKYNEEVLRVIDSIGPIDFASIQDWMCEPFMLSKTDKTISQHQHLTVQSYVDLLQLSPQVPWLPVLQGYRIKDYLAHLRMYEDYGIDLKKAFRVGVGSICRRQHTKEVVTLLRTLHSEGLRLHGFGLKIKGLLATKKYLRSADSLAWSQDARRMLARRKQGKPFRPCPSRQHDTMKGGCVNCQSYALAWRRQVLAQI